MGSRDWYWRLARHWLYQPPCKACNSSLNPCSTEEICPRLHQFNLRTLSWDFILIAQDIAFSLILHRTVLFCGWRGSVLSLLAYLQLRTIWGVAKLAATYDHIFSGFFVLIATKHSKTLQREEWDGWTQSPAIVLNRLSTLHSWSWGRDLDKIEKQ